MGEARQKELANASMSPGRVNVQLELPAFVCVSAMRRSIAALLSDAEVAKATSVTEAAEAFVSAAEYLDKAMLRLVKAQQSRILIPNPVIPGLTP